MASACSLHTSPCHNLIFLFNSLLTGNLLATYGLVDVVGFGSSGVGGDVSDQGVIVVRDIGESMTPYLKVERRRGAECDLKASKCFFCVTPCFRWGAAKLRSTT